MAEFKLGRLRFVWKDEWTSQTQYYKDDVIRYNASAYICVQGHVSNTNFENDLTLDPNKWNLISDGQTWKADWLPTTEYYLNDIVKYGGRLYICNTTHASTTSLEVDLSNWNVFAESIDWKDDWQLLFDYKINDTVRYGGNTYVCKTAHTSAGTVGLGLENDLAKWTLFNSGFDFKGDWSSNTRYKLNDVIKYGGNTFISIQYHTSTTFDADASNWSKFIEGFQYESRWNHEKNYQAGDIVSYGGNNYISKTNHSDSIPSQTPNDWDVFSEGIRWLGDWGDDSTQFEYEVGDLVRHGGYTYRAKVDHSGFQPPNNTYWDVFNTGISWRGEWLDDQEYLVGDAVRYGDNSYICVTTHISEGDDYSTETAIEPGGGAQNSRPDLDFLGTYWNVLVIGSETSVLTTPGDLVYYGNAGPTRLPIGDWGDVLSVSENNLPEWKKLSNVDDVYFVAAHGVDKPAPIHGKNVDQPWKSIRYATEQIEKGTKAAKAVRLLELNRRFIQREIVEWTDYQIANATVGSIWENFSYGSEKCERDMGFLIDAFIWDLSHGGNVRTREAALRYVNNPGQFYTLGQEGQTVASIQYGLSLIEKVLQQEAPAVNYQQTNGDNSTAIVEQYFEDALGNQAIQTYESTVTGRGEF